MPTIHVEQLEQLATDILRAAKADEHEAKTVSRHLVDSNLAGHASHGVMRLLQYVVEIEAGQIIPGAKMRVLDDWATGSVLDASGLFGQVACRGAMERAIAAARATAIAAVTIRHANHSGRLGTYVEMAAEAGLIGMVMANGGGGGQWVAPFGGRQRRLSTNPVAIGVPSEGPFPFILDISTSIAPEGKVRDYLQREQPVPDGWLVDRWGQPTNDPRELYADPGGALLPFGGSAGHKGFGLAFMVDVFAGVLSAAGCPRHTLAEAGNGSGLFMLAVDIQRFTPLRDFTPAVCEMAEYIKSSQPADGFDEVLVPGEFEYRERLRQKREGILIPDNVWNQLKALADNLGVPFKQELWP
jgi:uncharacterized oxidoreductase